jgi:hypothetical protein
MMLYLLLRLITSIAFFVLQKYPNHREICTWLELTEQRAYDKVCQALRDGATRIRQSMIAMSTNKKDSRIQDKENAVNEYH